MADYTEGAFIYCHEDHDWTGWPYVGKVCAYALRMGISWVRFDRDADVHPDLPVFDW